MGSDRRSPRTSAEEKIKRAGATKRAGVGADPSEEALPYCGLPVKVSHFAPGKEKN